MIADITIVGLAIGGSVDSVSLTLFGITLAVFLLTYVVNRFSVRRIRRTVSRTQDLQAIMQHTMDLRDNDVVRLDLRTRHASNMHGKFLPKDGMTYEESMEFIHPDDRINYRNFLLNLITGKKRTDECTFRWDASLQQHAGRWRHMHDMGVAEYLSPLMKTPSTIFCTITDVTQQVEAEQQEAEMTDRYMKVFEQGIAGLALYDHDGWLLNANQKLREILKFQGEDDPFYYGQTLFDMPSFRDLLSIHHVEDLYFCTKSVLVERGVNCYTELQVHPIYDDFGEVVYIAAAIRDVTQERELYLKNRHDDEQILKANEAIQQYEDELKYLMKNCDMRFWRISFAERIMTFYNGLTDVESSMNFEELKDSLVDDSEAFERDLAHPDLYFSEPVAYLLHTKPLFHDTDELLWNMVDVVPDFDNKGHLVGVYGVVRNVTDLIRKQELLKEETERANDSGRMKSVFMANMTHEIRTPLNSIVGFSDLLPMLSGAEEKKEIIRVIMNNCDMLLRLINDMLSLSTLNSADLDIMPEEVDFSHAFDDICESLAERVQNPNVQFIKENPCETLVTTLDRGRVQQVITNFVTNAVKYTQQGHIRVGYRLEERCNNKTGAKQQGIYIYCEDTGAGIPKEKQPLVFERFVKLNDFVQGTGLGLSICKAIAERVGGSIGVKSEGEGHGSTFWFWHPLTDGEGIKDEEERSKE